MATVKFGGRVVKTVRFVGESEARLRAISAIEGDLFTEQETLKAQVDPFGAKKTRLDMMKTALIDSKAIFKGLKLFFQGNQNHANLDVTDDDKSIMAAKRLLGATHVVGFARVKESDADDLSDDNKKLLKIAFMKKFPQLPDSVAIQKASELTKVFVQNRKIIIDVLKPLKIVNKADVKAKATEATDIRINDLTLGVALPQV